jgi:LysR family nitrogen assimilation transcriptional regulator
VLTGEAIARLPLIMPSPRHGLRLLVDNAFARHKLVTRVDVEADSLPSILALVEEGIGYTILPYAPVHRQLAAGRLRHWGISQPALSRRLLLATSTSRTATPATRALAKMVRQEVRKLVRSNHWSPHSPVAGTQSP